ncbi:hypothetical protein AGRA3207_004149 [Actinomadura graeca]|uniref:FUSC family protein n=1 Tax=Actinomadura graeca TaxID=2750812 RepID=A0ABX8QWA0_9ACTN|nr:hypothetical protein [Actinomadura graeca]QXJ23045.1 hypothetical protein AGRA3207_004149 [Actinomadura graeca]
MRQETAGGEQAAAGVRADGHQLENALAVAAITIGVAALILGSIPVTHFFGAVAAVIGLPLALYSQLVSATTNERWLNVIGMVAAFIGGAFAVSHGGFTI